MAIWKSGDLPFRFPRVCMCVCVRVERTLSCKNNQPLCEPSGGSIVKVVAFPFSSLSLCIFSCTARASSLLRARSPCLFLHPRTFGCVYMARARGVSLCRRAGEKLEKFQATPLSAGWRPRPAQILF